MNVEVDGDKIQISVHSFIQSNGKLKVIFGDSTIFEQDVPFQPMVLHSFQLNHPYQTDFEVIVENLDLHYLSNPSPIRIDRPYQLEQSILTDLSDGDQKFHAGYEFLKERHYQKAQDLFEEILEKSPNHLDANKGMADLYFCLLYTSPSPRD